MRENVHAQDTRVPIKSQDILRTTTIVYDIRHARIKRRVRGNLAEKYADVYAFMPVNVIHLCKLYRLQDKYSHGFDWIPSVSSRPYIAGANFTRSSVNLGISLQTLRLREPAALHSLPNFYDGIITLRERERTKNTRGL